MPTAEPVRIIQVGAGAMGQAWLKLLGESEQTELVGLVDLNTQLREPGYEEDETIQTGTRAALEGVLVKLALLQKQIDKNRKMLMKTLQMPAAVEGAVKKRKK